MRKGGGGIGMIVLLVAVLIVLLLVARAWRNMAPEALQVTQPGSGFSTDDFVDDEADYNSPGHLPDLVRRRLEHRLSGLRPRRPACWSK